MDNDMYVNDGEQYAIPEPFVPAEPETQVRERAEERSKTTAALPLIDDLIKRWEDKIDVFDRLDSIQANIDDDPALFQRIHAANTVIKKGYEEERDYLISLRDTYKS